MYVMSGEASRELVIVPGDESFTRPLGASIVLTCKVVTSDGQRPPAGSRLRWLDGNNQEIVDINGRSAVCSEKPHRLCCNGDAEYGGGLGRGGRLSHLIYFAHLIFTLRMADSSPRLHLYP